MSQIADCLSVSKTSVYKLIERQKTPTIRNGRLLHVKKDELDETLRVPYMHMLKRPRRAHPPVDGRVERVLEARESHIARKPLHRALHRPRVGFLNTPSRREVRIVDDDVGVRDATPMVLRPSESPVPGRASRTGMPRKNSMSPAKQGHSIGRYLAPRLRDAGGTGAPSLFCDYCIIVLLYIIQIVH